MPRGFLDYLKRGSLFRSEHIESSYRSFSEGDLRRELDLYRGYCLQYTNKRTSSKTDLTIFAESLNTFMPEEKLLKQCALYVDKVIINDPVFVHTIPRSELTEAMNLFLEMPASGIDRRRLSRSAAYVNRLRPAIQSGFAEILPISYLHEPPEEIPVMYSANLHADVLPVNMMEWFRAAAKVYPIRKAKEGWYVLHDQPLEPCRAISVNFKGHPSHTDALYFLAQFQPTSFDENTGEVEFIQQMPTTPPDLDTFNAWVFQSINQTAKHFFDRVIEELSVASSFNATYLTRSPFVADLLSKAWYQVPDFETDIINRVLRLELPVLEAIPLERVINLRQKDGEAFENFRVELAKRLRELRQITDPDELAINIQNVGHELSEVQVNEINRKIDKIKRGMFADAVIFVGGLVVTIQTKGLGIPALIYAMEKGYRTYSEYVSAVKENPAFFLWRLLN